MASTTKILTAICVIENCDINSIVKKYAEEILSKDYGEGLEEVLLNNIGVTLCRMLFLPLCLFWQWVQYLRSISNCKCCNKIHILPLAILVGLWGIPHCFSF